MGEPGGTDAAEPPAASPGTADPAAAVAGGGDGPTDAPWALQLAVRVERGDPPTVDAVCRASCAAVLALLDDPRCGPGGEWHEAVHRWRDGRIRKLVRRARGAAWERAQSVPGVTVDVGAEVRAFVPTPMNRVDDAVARLQIDGRAVDLAAGTASSGGGSPAGTDPGPGVLVVAITPMVTMSWGKQAAQAAHGAQLAWEAAGTAGSARWSAAGRPLAVVFPDAATWPAVVERTTVRVHDGGFTEIPAGTLTAVAWFTPAG